MKNLIIGLIVGLAIAIPVSTYAFNRNVPDLAVSVRAFHPNSKVTCYVASQDTNTANGANVAISCLKN